MSDRLSKRQAIFQKCRDAYIGVDALREKSETYLMSERLCGTEDDHEVFTRDMYVNSAPYYNMFAEDISYAKECLSTEQRDISFERTGEGGQPIELVESFIDICTPNDFSFEDVIWNMVEQILIVGSVFAFLDPVERAVDGVFDTENRLLLRFIPIDDIRDFSYDRDGRLEWVEFNTVARELVDGVITEIECRNEIFSNPYRVVKTYTDQPPVEEILTLRGQPSRYIMGGIYGADGLNANPTPQLSVFYDICNLSLNLYLLTAQATYHASRAAFLLMVHQRDQVGGIQEGKVNTPSKTRFTPRAQVIDVRDELRMLESNGNGVRAFMDHVEDICDKVLSKTISPRANDLRSNTSGRSVSIAMGRTKSVLGRLSAGLDRIQRDILTKFLTWYNIPYKVNVESDKKFSLDETLQQAEETETRMRSDDQAGTR